MKRLLPLIVGLSLVSCDSGTKEAEGTSSETQTTVVAHLYRMDGSPAAGASVRLFEIDDTTGAAFLQVYSGLEGEVVLPPVPARKYNLLASDGNGNGLILDSILPGDSRGEGGARDTLRPLATIEGRLQVQVQDSGRPLRLHVPGAGTTVWSDSSGRFRFEIPASRHQLVVVAPSALYSSTFRDFQASPGETLDLGVILLSYFGLPVVTGLEVSKGQGGAVAELRWGMPASGRIRSYEVLSKWDSNEFSFFWNTLDTTFVDAIYKPDWLDPDSHRIEYSVRVIDSAGNPGPDWISRSVQFHSPFRATPKGVVFDTLSAPPEGCQEIDTLSGGLLCISSKDTGLVDPASELGMRHWPGVHRADFLRVWFSADGEHWSGPLPIPRSALRVVAWRGAIWLARGIQAGDSITTVAMNTLIRVPRMAAVVVEGWTVDGLRLVADTLPSMAGTIGHRLVVHDDQLVLSDDFVKFNARISPDSIYGATSFHSSLRTRRLGSGEAWSEDPTDHIFSEDLNAYRNPAAPIANMEPSPLGSDPWQSWEGVEVLREGGYLLGRRPGDIFPWVLASPGALAMVRYRGDGENVPDLLVWRGCGLVLEEPSRLLRICRVP